MKWWIWLRFCNFWNELKWKVGCGKSNVQSDMKKLGNWKWKVKMGNGIWISLPWGKPCQKWRVEVDCWKCKVKSVNARTQNIGPYGFKDRKVDSWIVSNAKKNSLPHSLLPICSRGSPWLHDMWHVGTFSRYQATPGQKGTLKVLAPSFEKKTKTFFEKNKSCKFQKNIFENIFKKHFCSFEISVFDFIVS